MPKQFDDGGGGGDWPEWRRLVLESIKDLKETQNKMIWGMIGGGIGILVQLVFLFLSNKK